MNELESNEVRQNLQNIGKILTAEAFHGCWKQG